MHGSRIYLLLNLSKWENIRNRPRSELEAVIEEEFPGSQVSTIAMHMELMRFRSSYDYSVISHDDILVAISELIEELHTYSFFSWVQGIAEFLHMAFYDIFVWNCSLFLSEKYIMDYFPRSYEVMEDEIYIISILELIQGAYRNNIHRINATIYDLPEKGEAIKYIMIYNGFTR